ncbi:MAG TPA: NAD(P)-dependent oxidoreductase [Burkholderiales bacterium]|nr:NAD(P)-dependent oxidoreductase [Burkholderiales bacterium]
MASLPRIGWIGAGRMGVPMAGFIMKAGYPLMVWSRSAASRQKLVALGASEARDTASCAREAEVIFSAVADDAALRDVALGPRGVLANAAAGAVFADTSTVSPQVSEEVAREAAARGVDYLRMPISGNAASAQTGDITVLVSGPEAAWKRIKSIVETFSKDQAYLGEGEQARYMKLVTNAIIVSTGQALAEALSLGRKAGMEWKPMLDTIARSTIASPWLKAKIARLATRDFAPTMTPDLICKDMDLMLAAAAAHGMGMPLTARTRDLWQALLDEYASEDYMAAVKLAEKRAGLSTENVDASEGK